MIHDIGLFKSGPIDDAVSRFVGGRKDGWHGKERQARQEQNEWQLLFVEGHTPTRARACVRAWIGKRRRELSPLHPRDWEGEEMGYPARPIASYDYFRKRGDPCMSCGVILETYCSLEVV